jgi:GntR family transcriptional regulator
VILIDMPLKTQPPSDIESEAKLRLRRTGAPLYRDLATVLERAIRSGLWKQGDQIPTEGELESQFGASRGTLRAAIAELVRKGLLHRQPGRGTFVLGPSFGTLERFFRYERMAQDPQIEPRNQVLHRHMVTADPRAAVALGVAAGTELTCVRRLRSHQSEPFLLIDSYFPPDIWHRISDADFDVHPLYDAFKDRFDLYVVSADEYLRADLADDSEAGFLQIARGSPVIRLERIAYTFESRPVEFRRAVGRGDRFHYHVRLE